MKSLFWYLLLLLPLLFACEKEERGPLIEDFSTWTVSEFTNEKALWLCGFNVSIFVSRPKRIQEVSRLGFVYSDSNEFPTINDGVVETNFGPSLNSIRVKHVFPFGILEGTVNIRVFVEIDGEIYYIGNTYQVQFANYYEDATYLHLRHNGCARSGLLTYGTCDIFYAGDEYGLVYSNICDGEEIHGEMKALGVFEEDVSEIEIMFSNDTLFNHFSLFIREKDSREIIYVSDPKLLETSNSNISFSEIGTFPGLQVANASGFALCENGYICGGALNDLVSKELWKYHEVSNTWERKSDFPDGGRTNMAAFTIGNYAYLGTGTDLAGNITSDFYRYDCEKDEWTEIASFPAASYSGAAFSVDGMGYVGAYYDINGKLQTKCYRYDPAEDTWSEVASLPSDTHNSWDYVASSVRDKGYVVKYNAQEIRICDYRPVSNEWFCEALNVDLNKRHAVVYSFNNKLYISLGIHRPYLIEYDPIDRCHAFFCTYELSSRESAAGFALKNKLFLVGGNVANNDEVFNSNVSLITL